MKSSKQQTLKRSPSQSGHKAQKFVQNQGKTEELKIEPPKDNSYDPKKCIKKPLEELIPTIGESVVFEIDQHHHFINFYKASKAFIPYYEAQTKIHPGGMIGPYSDFVSFVGKLTWKTALKNNINQQLKVDLYQSEFGLKYVLKTCWLFLNPSMNDPDIHETPESFARKKYSEFVFAKIYSSCPYSVKIIDLNFIYLKSENLFISELLETFGGERITKANALKLPILDSQIVYNILLQNAHALNFLEVLNLAHNDIKGDNILIDDFLGQILIRYIDFDIGDNQSSTVKDTKLIGPKGYTNIYVAPEIYKYAKDKNPVINPGIYSPRKCQVYSMAILILQLIGFFSNQMNDIDLDNYKLSEDEYQKFWIIFDKYSKTITDHLMGKILSILKICLSYKSDDRLSGNELIEILSGLISKTENSIKNEYESIIGRRGKHHQTPLFSSGAFLSISDQRNEESKGIFNVPKSENQTLKVEIKSLKYEMNESKIQLEKVATELLSLVNPIIKSPIKVETQKYQLQSSNNFKKIYSKILQELNDLIKNSKNEVHTLNQRNAMLEKQIKDLTEKVIEYENSNKTTLNQLNLLKTYEKEHNEINLKLNEIKKKIQDENIVKISENSSYSELTLSLYGQLQELQKEKPLQNLKFQENVPYKNDSMFTGQVNEKGIPHGVGILVYPTLKVKVTCEFSQGEVKNNMGMLINKYGQYFFGRIKEGICQSPIFIIPQYTESRIEKFYFGETKNNIQEGKGKYVFENGNYYDGDWKNSKIEGKGKHYIVENGQIKQILEGTWINDKREGKFLITNIDKAAFYAEYKDNKKIN